MNPVDLCDRCPIAIAALAAHLKKLDGNVLEDTERWGAEDFEIPLLYRIELQTATRAKAALALLPNLNFNLPLPFKELEIDNRDVLKTQKVDDSLPEVHPWLLVALTFSGTKIKAQRPWMDNF